MQLNEDNKALGFGCHWIKSDDGTVRKFLVFDDAIRVDVMEEGTDFDPEDSTVVLIRLNAPNKV